MKILTLGVLAALAVVTAGCSGCSTIDKVMSNTPVMAGQKIDEQAMGAVDALGTSTNYLITAAAHSGKLNRDQLIQLQGIRHDLDLAHDAALAAYNAGDAATFSQKTGAVKDLALKVQALYEGVVK